MLTHSTLPIVVPSQTPHTTGRWTFVPRVHPAEPGLRVRLLSVHGGSPFLCESRICRISCAKLASADAQQTIWLPFTGTDAQYSAHKRWRDENGSGSSTEAVSRLASPKARSVRSVLRRYDPPQTVRRRRSISCRNGFQYSASRRRSASCSSRRLRARRRGARATAAGRRPPRRPAPRGLTRGDLGLGAWRRRRGRGSGSPLHLLGGRPPGAAPASK